MTPDDDRAALALFERAIGALERFAAIGERFASVAEARLAFERERDEAIRREKQAESDRRDAREARLAERQRQSLDDAGKSPSISENH